MLFNVTELTVEVSQYIHTTMDVGRSVARIFVMGGAQLDGEVVIVHSKAVHGQLCWP